MTVGEVCTYLQGRAPFETAEEYDNVGLLVGSPDMPACRILVTLDITPPPYGRRRRRGPI